jgi:hypothetical protein
MSDASSESDASSVTDVSSVTDAISVTDVVEVNSAASGTSDDLPELVLEAIVGDEGYAVYTAQDIIDYFSSTVPTLEEYYLLDE